MAFVTLILVLAIARTAVRRWTFTGFLVLSSLQILLWDFPDLGNHNNIYLLCNLFLIAAIVHASLRRKAPMDDDELLAILKPPLRVMLSLGYFFAGFHKLNVDSPGAGIRHTQSVPMVNQIVTAAPMTSQHPGRARADQPKTARQSVAGPRRHFPYGEERSHDRGLVCPGTVCGRIRRCSPARSPFSMMPIPLSRLG